MSELRYTYITDAVTGKTVAIESNGGMAVNIQDQATPGIIAKFNEIQDQTITTALAAKNQRYIVIADVTSIVLPVGDVDGSYIILYSSLTDRYYIGHVVGLGGNTVELDTPLDSEYPSGANVDISITNMNVNGSAATPRIFGIRGDTPQSVNVIAHITRIIFKCFTTGAVSLSTFADISKLSYGLVVRRADGTFQNIFNVKTNGDLEGITLDWKPYSASNPQQGQNGFTCRLTFNGPDKMGIVQSLAPDEDLQILIQDPLNGGSITLLECTAEGHLTFV